MGDKVIHPDLRPKILNAFDTPTPLVKISVAEEGGEDEMEQQNPLERSFKHTWSADGDSDIVLIPNPGMLDAEYVVSLIINTIPVGGSAAILVVPESSRTQTQFTIDASGTMLAGTIIDVILRDSE